jgi:Tfp pilus assembly protein PilV
VIGYDQYLHVKELVMNHLDSAHRRGFVLLDALIAVVVVGIGLLGVAKLNSVMLASTGLAKTRAEATQLAEGKLEEIRAQQPPASKPTSSTSPESISGVNASFQRSWTIVTAGVTGMDLDKIAVCVSWGDSCGGTGEKKVELNGLVTWTNLSTAAAIGSGEGGMTAGHPETPTGVAVEGGNNGEPYTTLPSGTGVTINNDGTRIYQKSDKVTELIDDGTKRVLLTISDGSDFSTITGRVYITWGSAVNKKDKSDITLTVVKNFIQVLGSGGSVCQQFVSGGGTTLPPHPTSGTTKFSYFNYTCYMGAGWYGNIAIVRFDGGDRVCLGDPEISSSDATPTSRRPLLNTMRNYRGYAAACTTSPTSSACKSKGIGMSGASYASVHLGGISWSFFLQHDFLLTTIKGQPSNQDCAVEEAKPTLIASPFTPSILPPRLGNTGLLYCLSTTCPIASGFVTFQTNFSLTLTTPSTTPPVVDIDGGQCATPTETASPFVYHCQIDWLGWSGDYWTGNITLSMADGSSIGGALSNVVLGAISPDEGIVTLNNPVVGCDGTCVQFTKVTKDVTSFSLSLNIVN